MGGGKSPINDRRNWDGYIVNNKVVRIKPKQGLEMMGFPKSFKNASIRQSSYETTRELSCS